jgi:hypothetical protein
MRRLVFTSLYSWINKYVEISVVCIEMFSCLAPCQSTCKTKSPQNAVHELLTTEKSTSGASTICSSVTLIADRVPVAAPVCDSLTKECDDDSDTCDDNINNATFTLSSSKHLSSPTLCPRPQAPAATGSQSDSQICSPPCPPGIYTSKPSDN